MQSSFLANTDAKRVSEGMMLVVSSLEGFTKAEKCAIISSVFNCLYHHKFERRFSEVMGVVDNMRIDCKLKKIPEFGGAEKFIQGEK